MLILTLGQVLGRLDFVCTGANRRYLLDKTQHLIGGFGKMAGEPPGRKIPILSRLFSLTRFRRVAFLLWPGGPILDGRAWLESSQPHLVY